MHLRERLIQSNAWNPDRKFTKVDLTNLLIEKINITNFEDAKMDVLPFLKDPESIVL